MQTHSSADNRGSKIEEERTGEQENRKKNGIERRGETIRREKTTERGQRRDRTRIDTEQERKDKRDKQ